MIDRTVLTGELAKQVTALEDDLRRRADEVPEVAERVQAEWRAAHTAGRTAHDLPTWRETLLTQVAVAWVLGTVFVRFCEDNGLLPTPVLSGGAERRRQAEEAQRAWYRDHPAAGERGYVLSVFRDMARLPGLSHVFEQHNPVWQFGPSDDAVKVLLAYWREVNPETGDLRRPLDDPDLSTRFLGDLYQDLSQHAKKQYALLQTPEFVEEFILDRTLDPALDEFGLDGFRMIDPACGSGHFLLGAFARLLARWQRRAPQDGDRANAERALQSVFGVDLNPFAAAIARFRLLAAALTAASIRTLAEAPDFTINVAVGDSLLHGPPPGQGVFEDVEQSDPASRHIFATENRETLTRFLSQHYQAVVANPPYITPKDPGVGKVYKRRYPIACHGQFHLSSPFLQRVYDLAASRQASPMPGWVGVLQDNAFMKRAFGRPLVEVLMRSVELSHVVDTESLNIGGHGTATVILFGRGSPPVSNSIRCARGVKGDEASRTDPKSSSVWREITGHLDEPGWSGEHAQVFDVPSVTLLQHPMALMGTDMGLLVAKIEAAGPRRLSEAVEAISTLVKTREDDAYLIEHSSWRRFGVDGPHEIEFGSGDGVRDWSISSHTNALFPYDGELNPECPPSMERILWSARQHLIRRKELGGFQLDIGKTWYEWSRFLKHRFREPLGLCFAFVSTDCHFAVTRRRMAFGSAPVVKASDASSDSDLLELVGPMNSSVALMWLKQVMYCKGVGGVNEGFKAEQWERYYEFDGTKLKQFPIPDGSALPWAERLDGLAQELSANLPSAVAERDVPTRDALDAAHRRVDEIRAEMVSAQEELDWRCLHLYGVTADDLSLAPNAVPPIDRGQRTFEIVLARKMAAGEVSTTWFTRHGSTPITEIPAHWPDDYRALVQRRIDLIESDRNVGLVERPEYKRRWNWDAWEALESEALRGWLLDRLEDPRYWPRAEPRSAAHLADAAARDADFVSVARTYARRVDVDLAQLISDLVKDESVPYLSAWRYTASGLRKRAAWERTWDLQRKEDTGEEVGPIPVPPKYGKPDFASDAAWKLRGKLDVPKERFIAYPGLGRATDPTPLVGWAGWDHLQAAQALAWLYQQRRTVDGWDPAQLTPVLAGLAELVPWLQQWHNDVDPKVGVGMGDFFADFVTSETAVQGLSADDLAQWQPPRAGRGRKKKADTA